MPTNTTQTDRFYLQLVRKTGVILFVLVALNLIVYLALLLRFIALPWLPNYYDSLTTQALIAERHKLEGIVGGSCAAPEIGAYQRGEIGPLNVQRSPSSPQISPPAAGLPQESLAPSAPRMSPRDVAQGQASLPPGTILTSADLAALLEAATVRVITENGFGTGFLIAADIIVTNRHVVEDAHEIFVASKHVATPVPAKVLAATPSSAILQPDFAILAISSTPELRVLPIAGDPVPLESVVAIGYPGDAIESDPNEINPDPVFTQGEVSVVQQRDGGSLIIHTADIAPGSSGGPLVDRCGAVVGVNTFFSPSDENSARRLYSLGASSLTAFLTSNGYDFNVPSRPCESR